MPTKLKMFYACQSDTPAELNHYSFRESVRRGENKLSVDARIEQGSFELDYDTRAVPACPLIAGTNCRKWDECCILGILVRDVAAAGEYTQS
jgi:hypothetical protein